MDPLSDVLALLDIRAGVPTRLEAGGDWALRFSGRDRAKFGFVVAGGCWLTGVAGHGPQRLEPGDCYLLAAAGPYVLTADPALPPEDGDARYRRAARDGLLRVGRHADATVLVGGSLHLDDANARLLLEVLPPLLHVRATPVLRTTMEFLAGELGRSDLGAALVVDHLAAVVCVQMLRAAVDQHGEQLDAGWLRALADPQIGRALHRIHADPARAWTVPQLAAAVGLSRSTFAARFTRLVGSSPLAYLQRWRMTHAAEALRRPGATVTGVAFDYGYPSHSAFSNAFKRALGVAPTTYVRSIEDSRERTAASSRSKSVSERRSPSGVSSS